MGELSKRIYFGGRYAVRRWENYKKLAKLHFKGSVAALIRHALSETYHLDVETGEPMNAIADIVSDETRPAKPNPRKARGSTGVANYNKSK